MKVNCSCYLLSEMFFASFYEFESSTAFVFLCLSFKFGDVTGTVNCPAAVRNAQQIYDKVVDCWHTSPHLFEHVFEFRIKILKECQRAHKVVEIDNLWAEFNFAFLFGDARFCSRFKVDFWQHVSVLMSDFLPEKETAWNLRDCLIDARFY